MANKSRRIILDTNLWISFLITKDYTRLDNILFSKKCILVFSTELLEEFLEVAKRPKFRSFFSSSDIEDLLELLNEYADFVKVVTKVKMSRDPKDDFLLALAVDGKADILLTGDQDLLVFAKYNNTTIITISDFFDKY